jgi:cytochrome b6-f complex iron-sulfur subunit
MGSDDIPGFDEDPELEELLTSDLSDLDEETLADVQRYKSQKLKAKRDADCATDRPGWWPEGASAPERLSEVGSGGGSSTSGGEASDTADEEPADEETAEEPETDTDQESTEEPADTEDTADADSETESEQEQVDDGQESEPEAEPAGTTAGDESVEIDISETDFEIDPEMEELLDQDVFELDEETREDVQLYKSRKMQAKRDARREAGGGESAGDDAQAGGSATDEEGGLSKQAPPPTDTGRYKGERKVKDLVSSRDTGREVTRRGFISSFGLGWLGTLAAFGTGALSTARYFYPNVLSNPPQQFIAGEPSDFAPNTVSSKFKDQYRVWIANLGNRLVAILAVCTHLGCTPSWISSQGIFKCPCHGSAYYMNGVNFAGPAPRPMDRVAIRLNPQGKIVVDKSKQFSSQAQPGWNADSAYIPV